MHQKDDMQVKKRKPFLFSRTALFTQAISATAEMYLNDPRQQPLLDGRLIPIVLPLQQVLQIRQ
jgi:hypothetical protein